MNSQLYKKSMTQSFLNPFKGDHKKVATSGLVVLTCRRCTLDSILKPAGGCGVGNAASLTRRVLGAPWTSPQLHIILSQG